MASETRYAETRDGVHIAYQVVGDGPIDIVLVVSGLGLGRSGRGVGQERSSSGSRRSAD